MGGRSRVAAQMMGKEGFENVYNLSGGIKAWHGETAVGPVEQGLSLFDGRFSPDESLLVAYSLEQGLRDFYLSVLSKVSSADVKQIFQTLADIEIKHQDRIFKEYINVVGRSISRQEFEKQTISGVIEGGMTTDEYVAMFDPHLGSVIDVISLAMSIEAQALDLYQRAAEAADIAQTKQLLIDIAGEERSHLNQLGGVDGSSVI